MTELTEIGGNKFRLNVKSSDFSCESIIDTTRVIEEFDINVQFKSDNDVQCLKKLFQEHGGSVKKLFWSNASKFQLPSVDVIKMLNCFPSLEFLKLSSWCKKFTNATEKLQLPNIKSLEFYDCENFIIDFIAHALTEKNSIHDLKINNGSRHRISFIAKAFPNLESMNIKFGVSSNPVKFEHVYDMNDVVALPNLKILKLKCCIDSKINAESFLKFVGIFPSLEKLHIESKLPFTADFIKRFTEKLNNIKSIKLFFFEIKNKEEFPSEVIDALRLLQSKLESVYLLLMNLQAIDFGGGINENEEGRDDEFNYKRLMEALDDVYELNEAGCQNTRIYNQLEMYAGIPDSWYDE